MADLILSGVVGEDITGDTIKEFLASNDDPEITVFINSPGGYVFDGLEIYSLLRASGRKIKTVLTGLAASMGSIIFLAGDERVAMTGTLYMVHKPSGLAWGNADDLRKEVELLDKIQISAADIYTERTGIEDKDIDLYMNKESWFGTEEMKELGITNSDEDIKLGRVEDMSKIDDLKAELETAKAEKAELEEKVEEARLEKELAKEKAAIAKMQAEAELEEPVDESKEIDEEPVDESEKTDTPVNPDEPEDVVADEDKKVKAIDTSKTTAVKKQNAIPAFMDYAAKY